MRLREVRRRSSAAGEGDRREDPRGDRSDPQLDVLQWKEIDNGGTQHNIVLVCNHIITQSISYKIEVRSTYARSDRSIRAFYGQDVFLFQALIG